MLDEKKPSSIGVKIKKKRAVKFQNDQNEIRRTTISDELATKQIGLVLKNEKSNETNFIDKNIQKQNINAQKCQIYDNKIKQIKNQYDIKMVLDEIKVRGDTFCKFSLFSSQKKKQSRKVFGQYFNLKAQQMRGTMTVGQLWTNKQKVNFLKQNKIHVGKMKLHQKINQFNKQQNKFKKGKRTQSQGASTFQEFLESYTQIKTTQTMPMTPKNDRKKIKTGKFSEKFMRFSQKEPKTSPMLSTHKVKILPQRKRETLTTLHSKNDINFLIMPCSRYQFTIC